MLCAGAIVLLTLFVFGPLTARPGDLLVGPQRGGLNDLTAQWLAFRAFAAQGLADFGDYPVWNPYRRAGAPWVGDPQVAWLYPPNWLFLILDVWPLTTWLLVLHHAFGGLGTFFLCRTLGVSHLGSLIGGLVFLGSPYLVAHTAEGHVNHVQTVAWYPWVFLGFKLLQRGWQPAGSLLATLLTLALFGGHIQEWYYLVLALLAFTAGDLLASARRAGAPRAFRRGYRFMWPLAAAVSLSAVELLPVWIYSRLSVRAAGLAVENPGTISLGLPNLLQLVYPEALGGPSAYSGPGLYYWETLLHVGLLPLVLAGAGLVLGWRGFSAGAFAVLGFVSVAFAFGDGSPVFAVLHELVPGMGWFRAPARALFLTTVAVAVLCAIGLDRLQERLGSVFRRKQHIATAFGATVLVLCAAELAGRARPLMRTIPRDAMRGSPVVRMLESEEARRRVIAPQHLLSDREAWAARLEKIQSYDSTPLLSITAVAEAMSPAQHPIDFLLGFSSFELSNLHKPLVDLLAIGFAVTGQMPTASSRGWTLEASGTIPAELALRGRRPGNHEYFLFRNDTAMPRAFAVGSVSELPLDENAVEALRELEPRREVLLVRDVLPRGERSEFVAAAITHSEPNRVVVTVDLDRPGYLVLSDAWYPGWTARAAGQTLPVLRANVAFRAVPLQAGSHRVVFEYRPPGLAIGALMSLLTLASLIAATVRQRRTRRTSSVPP